MAYQRGNATNAKDLLQQLATFAKEECQWTVIEHFGDGVARCYVTDKKGGSHFAIEFRDNKIYTIPCTSLDRLKPALEQKGTPYEEGNCYRKIATQTTQLEKGNFIGYDFFGTEDYLYVVVEIAAERYRHFGVGKLLKEAEFTGGEFSFGTYIYDENEGRRNNKYNIYGMGHGQYAVGPTVRVDGLGGDTHSPRYMAANSGYYVEDNNGNTQKGKSCYMLGRSGMPDGDYDYHPFRDLVRRSQSKFGNVLIPTPNVVIGHLLTNQLVILGTVPDRYECMMTGITPGDILDIFGERWKIFPCAGYNSYNKYDKTTNPDNTGHRGIAYRIVES